MDEALKWLSISDLEALKAGDISKVSTQGLQRLKQEKLNQGREQMKREMGLDPTKGGSSFLAGIGQGMASGVRALGGGSLLEKYDLPGSKEEADQLDAPLRETISGKIGSAVGMGALAAPVALVPGANTYAGATLLGALSGGALTEGDLGDRAKGAAFGAAGGVAGKAAGDLIGKGASWLTDRRATSRATQQAANTQRDAAALAARESGYVLPPPDVKGGLVNEALGGLSGKIKTAQTASARNQGTTDKLAREAIGLKEGAELTEDVLQGIRTQAAEKGYTPVKASGAVQADDTFFKALDDIGAASKGASRSFPGLKDNGVSDLVDTLKQPIFDAGDAIDATRVLRDMADQAYRKGDKTIGKAYKQASDAVENQLERHLQSQGMPDALSDFKEARKLIAKTYSVQGAANTQTGHVSAEALAKQLSKGKPLSGELKTIAEISTAFPKATQMLKEAPKAVSPLDYAVAGGAAASSGNVAQLALLGARPAVRSAILSKPYQALMLNNNYAPRVMDRTLLPLLSSEPMRRGLIPLGIGAGLLTQDYID